VSRRPASPWIFLERDLLKSRAWLDLVGIAPQVYGLLRLRVQVHRVKQGREGKRASFETINNGQICFGYAEAQRDFRITSPRFKRALKELVERGFLDVAYHGGGLEGNPTRYAISERWRTYGTADFEAATMTKGRRWTTRATNVDVRGGTNVNVRGC
jgi:hypothetical protein